MFSRILPTHFAPNLALFTKMKKSTRKKHALNSEEEDSEYVEEAFKEKKSRKSSDLANAENVENKAKKPKKPRKRSHVEIKYEGELMNATPDILQVLELNKTLEQYEGKIENAPPNWILQWRELCKMRSYVVRVFFSSFW